VLAHLLLNQGQQGDHTGNKIPIWVKNIKQAKKGREQ